MKTIGARLREARELCNMSQQRAAEALGYSNSSKLAKIEGATDTNSVPLYLIPKAATLYDVSTDFLFGLTEDWERGEGGLEDRESFGWLQAKRVEDRKRDEEMYGTMSRQMRAVSTVVCDMEPLIDLLKRGVYRAGLDTAFEEINGSAGIVSAAERIDGVFKIAQMAFKKAKLDMEGGRAEPNRGFPNAVAEMSLMSDIDRPHAIREAARLYQLPVDVVRTIVEREYLARSIREGRTAQLELSV